MVLTCVVFGCHYRQGSGTKEKGISFFRFPTNPRKNRAWVEAVNRANWEPSKHSRICSEHFVDGWHSDDPNDVNFRPTLFTYKTKPPTEASTSRTDRRTKRNILQEVNDQENQKRKRIQSRKDFSLFAHSYSTQESTPPTDSKNQEDKEIQCDFEALRDENNKLRAELEKEKKRFDEYKWGVGKIKNNDERTRFYTGLPSFAVFLWLFNFIQEKAGRMRYWIGQRTETTTDRQRASTGGPWNLLISCSLCL